MLDNIYIPILGVPFLNKIDLLSRFINSINCKVGLIVIVDNSYYDSRTVEGFNNIRNYFESKFQKYEIVSNNKNIGVPCSWNYILKNYDSDFYCIGSADIELSKNDLFSMCLMSNRIKNKPSIITTRNGHPTGFPFFGLSKKIINKIGYFDEDFYPGFYEDDEYLMRVRKNRCTEIRYEFKFTHGVKEEFEDTCSMNYNVFMHDKYRDIINNNRELLLSKWGTDVFRSGFTYDLKKVDEIKDYVAEIRERNCQYLFSEKTITFITIVKYYNEIYDYSLMFNDISSVYSNIKWVCIGSYDTDIDLTTIFNFNNKFYFQRDVNDYVFINNIIDDVLDGYICVSYGFSEINIDDGVIDQINNGVGIIKINNSYILDKREIKYNRFKNKDYNNGDIIEVN